MTRNEFLTVSTALVLPIYLSSRQASSNMCVLVHSEFDTLPIPHIGKYIGRDANDRDVYAHCDKTGKIVALTENRETMLQREVL